MLDENEALVFPGKEIDELLLKELNQRAEHNDKTVIAFKEKNYVVYELLRVKRLKKRFKTLS